jgi:hypothetical protein
MKATNNGTLNVIPNCYIDIPLNGANSGCVGAPAGTHRICLDNLPDVSDTKSAVYNSEAIIGRAFPLYTYSHSGDRQINIQLHFFAVERANVNRNIADLRAVQSAVYPREGISGAPYRPPTVCRIKCGNLLTGNPAKQGDAEELCVILQSYSVKFPTEVAFDAETITPYRFDLETSWLTVYSSEDLPWANRIYRTGR